MNFCFHFTKIIVNFTCLILMWSSIIKQRFHLIRNSINSDNFSGPTSLELTVIFRSTLLKSDFITIFPKSRFHFIIFIHPSLHVIFFDWNTFNENFSSSSLCIASGALARKPEGGVRGSLSLPGFWTLIK